MQDFEEIIINNWATRFQCSVSTIRQNGTTLLPDEKYANQNLVILWHIDKHSFALFDPSDTALLRDIIVRLPINTSLSGDNIQQVLGINAISSHDIDLIHYLPPSDLPNLATPHSFHVRELALSDQEYLSALRSNCTPEEVGNGYVDIEHEIAFGCFHDNELVSAASGYRMAGFMNIAVLTHTKFRKLGLGKVVVGALCKWAVVHNIIAQYRCNTHNTGSLGVARSLNFRHYFSSESIVITH
jgi:GNAT acetyltransferase